MHFGRETIGKNIGFTGNLLEILDDMPVRSIHLLGALHESETKTGHQQLNQSCRDGSLLLLRFATDWKEALA